MPEPDLAACAVCGAGTRFADHAGFRFRECPACGFSLLDGAGERADYWAGAHDGEVDDYWIGARRRYFDSTLTLLGALVARGRLLDVGGGVGFFAERALERRWDAYSLDVSPRASRVASDRIGAERAWTSLRAGEEGTFDAVTLWCVVAHTVSPADVVAVAARALRPGGVVWVTTPNFAFQKPYAHARSLLRRPLDLAADDHLGQFTARALQTLLRRGGFDEVRFHVRGVTETCVAARSSRRSLVEAKRAWNAFAGVALRLGLPNVSSELQATARRHPGVGERSEGD